MPSVPFVLRSTTPEGSDIVSAFRVVHALGNAILKAEISSWDLNVYDISEIDASRRRVPIYSLLAQTSAATNTPLPSTPAVFFDTYQTDGYWQGRDSTGYNVLHSVTLADLESLNYKVEGGGRIKLEYKIKLSAVADTQVAYATHITTFAAHESS